MRMKKELRPAMKKMSDEGKPFYVNNLDELSDIDEKIQKYEEYVKEHPERLGMKGNIKTLKYVKEVLSKNEEK